MSVSSCLYIMCITCLMLFMKGLFILMPLAKAWAEIWWELFLRLFSHTLAPTHVVSIRMDVSLCLCIMCITCLMLFLKELFVWCLEFWCHLLKAELNFDENCFISFFLYRTLATWTPCGKIFATIEFSLSFIKCFCKFTFFCFSTVSGLSFSSTLKFIFLECAFRVLSAEARVVSVLFFGSL